MTNFPRELCEQALAHVIADETEAAYRRSDALAKRRLLMDEWAAYCDVPIEMALRNRPMPLGFAAIAFWAFESSRIETGPFRLDDQQ